MAHFTLQAKTINGDILEAPKKVFLNCLHTRPIGFDVIRQYDANECINAAKVLIISSEGNLFGTQDFDTIESYINYQNNSCVKKEDCFLAINGCYALINGCRLN